MLILKKYSFILGFTFIVMAVILAACGGGATATPTPAQGAAPQATTASGGEVEKPSEVPELTEVARPSNAGGPGPALQLTGDATAGQQIFSTTCTPCHGAEGKGGVANPGSTDGTIPSLNPIDPTLASSDPKTFAYNIDLFIEHGSTPEGTKPQVSMLPFGDQKILTPQQIADVIAYVISLNQK